jgi:hypothetical protein
MSALPSPPRAAGLLPSAAGLLPGAAGLLPGAAGLLPSAAGLLLALAACAAPPQVDDWGDISAEIGGGLDASQLRLEEALASAFPAGNADDEAVRRGFQRRLRGAYAPVLESWAAYADYAREAEFALAEDGPRGAARLRDAFHALHVALLETRLRDDFGIDPEQHRAVLAGIAASGSVATAFALAHPYVEHLADGTHAGAEALPAALESLATDAQEALRARAEPLLGMRAQLYVEEDRLADLMRRRAAGVGEVTGNPARELRALREELATLEPEWAAYEAHCAALDAAFRAARVDASVAVQGFHAWGAVHGRVADALRSGRADADLSLLRSLAEDLAR